MHRLLLVSLLSVCVFSETPPHKAPDNITWRRANIYSEGTRMAAEVFAPAGAADKKLPTILMAHGWGGTAYVLRRDATSFAQHGYLVVTFDYRGWGDSDSRLSGSKSAPQDVREVVDPLDMAADWFNALHWLQAEPQCDTSRIGLWGSSFSGGLVVYVAARDPRVKAIHSQVGALDGRTLAGGAEITKTYEEATKRARGEIGYPAPGAKEVGNLRGAPIRARFLDYVPVDDIQRAPNCAMQFVLAEKEELFDNRDHGIKAHERAKGPKNLVIIPKITHYGIYTQVFDQANKLALEWFDKYVKP